MHAPDPGTWTKRRGATACVFATVIRTKPDSRCVEHAHPCAEIVHVGRSSGTLVQEGVAYRYAAGSVFLYQPGAPHAVAHGRGGDHTCLGAVGDAVGAIAPGLWSGGPHLERLFADCWTRSCSGMETSPSWIGVCRAASCSGCFLIGGSILSHVCRHREPLPGGKSRSFSKVGKIRHYRDSGRDECHPAISSGTLNRA